MTPMKKERTKKLILEQQIQALVEKFENNTGLCVEGVEIVHIRQLHPSSGKVKIYCCHTTATVVLP